MNFVPWPGSCSDFDFAVERVEIGADNVETDAAAGEFRFRMRGGEAGTEKHFAEFAFGEPVGGDRATRARRSMAAADAIVIDAAAVVFDFDVDVVAAMIGADETRAVFGFASVAARVGVFDAVRDGIADEVNERIGNLLDDVVVEFGLLADEIEIDELAGGLAASRTARESESIEMPMGTMRAAVISSCRWCASLVNSSMSPSTRPM